MLQPKWSSKLRFRDVRSFFYNDMERIHVSVAESSERIAKERDKKTEEAHISFSDEHQAEAQERKP